MVKNTLRYAQRDKRRCCLLLPIGSLVVPFYGSYLESYKAIPKRNY